MAYFYIAWMFYNSVGLSGWPIFSLLGYSITVWAVAYFYIAWMLYNSVGVSGWPILTLLVCSISVWVCLGGLFFHFYSSVVLFGWPNFHYLDVLLQCGCVWVAYFFVAWMFYNSVGVSGSPIFTLLGCSITVWVCLCGLILHCLDVL